MEWGAGEVDMSQIEHELKKPVEAHGAELTVLVLKEPTGEQIGRIGLPYMAVGDNPDFKMGTVMKYVSVLASVPPSTVNQLSPSDLNDLAWKVCSFFLA